MQIAEGGEALAAAAEELEGVNVQGIGQALRALTEKENEEKKPRKRRKKDPLAPKRPGSAYTFFMQEELAKLRGENPGMSQKEIMAMAAHRWRSLGPGQRTRFDNLATEAKEIFREQMSAYMATKDGDVAAPPAKRSGRQVR